jgi:hypothetical protein
MNVRVSQSRNDCIPFVTYYLDDILGITFYPSPRANYHSVVVEFLNSDVPSVERYANRTVHETHETTWKDTLRSLLGELHEQLSEERNSITARYREQLQALEACEVGLSAVREFVEGGA